MKLDEFHNLPQAKIAKSHHLIMPKTDLDTDLDIRVVRKLTKSLREIKSKVYKTKIYDEVIDNPIHKNR